MTVHVCETGQFHLVCFSTSYKCFKKENEDFQQKVARVNRDFFAVKQVTC